PPERVPDDADARLEVVLVVVDLVAAGLAHLQQLGGRGVEVDEAVLRLGRRDDAGVAQAELDARVRFQTDVVLYEESERLLGDVAVEVAERDREGRAAPGLEVREARVGEGAA